VSGHEEIKDVRDDARRVYGLLKEQFADSTDYWQLGCCFDTMTDALRILGPALDTGLPKQALLKYNQTSGAWYDDFAWWSIASAKAYDPAFAGIFREYAETFKGIAQGCWSVLDEGLNDGVHNGSSQAFVNRDNLSYFTTPPVVPRYWATPRFDNGRGSGLHGVWQKDIFANRRDAEHGWVGPAEFDPNPSMPSDAVKLGPYQNTVVNALYLLNAVRLELARRTDPGIPTVAQQMEDEFGFLWTWMGFNPSQPLPSGVILLNEQFNDGTALVRERVCNYAFDGGQYPPVQNWDPITSWGGDQGLMINALSGFMQLQPSNLIATLLRSLLLGYSRHEVDAQGVPQPYFPITGNKLADWDPGDYASGVGVFMRGVLQAARFAGGPISVFVRLAEFQSFLRRAVAWASAAQPDDLFGCLNVLATLLAGIELLVPTHLHVHDVGYEQPPVAAALETTASSGGRRARTQRVGLRLRAGDVAEGEDHRDDEGRDLDGRARKH
jgi:hypothetical protein